MAGEDDERFWTFVERVDGCLVWLGASTASGYPEFQVGGRTVYAHRWSYEHHVGPIRDGLELHHECETRACVDWTHVVPLTRAAHARRHRGMKL